LNCLCVYLFHVIMNSYLITGFSGFVSRHFLEYLNEHEPGARVLGVDTMSPDFDCRAYGNISCRFEKLDLLDRPQADNLIYQFQPRYVLHLASFSSVAYSWKDPVASFRNNTNIFLNLLEKIRGLGIDCRILSIGSSEEYGIVGPDYVPIKEECPLNPVSPYAVARVAQEMLSRVYVDGYGLDIVMTRSFNHIGPRQRDVFAVSSFIRQIAEMKIRGQKKGELVVGDVSVVRDFLDVRDVVVAYHALLKHGDKGEVYNVCSGKGVALVDVIEKVARMAGIEVTINRSEKLLRPSENPIVIGSNEKIKNSVGWELRYELDASLEDILAYWVERLNV
jgi:GDP-4-dehydro-6-deoxy-D-mannose reductase